MSNGTEGERDQFKARDTESYNLVAERFGYWTDRVTSPLAQRLVALGCLGPDSLVLDVGSGSGVVARTAIRNMQGTGRVIAIDLSAGMLKVASQIAVRAEAGDRLQLRRMDAERLDLEDCSMDRVLSLFAFLHFPSPEDAIREVARVLKPGGRVAIGIGVGPDFSWPLLRGAAYRINEQISHFRGTLLTAPEYLDRLVDKHLPPDAALPAHSFVPLGGNSLTALFSYAGLQVESTKWDSQTHVLSSPDEFWDLQFTFSSASRKRLQAARKEDVEKVRRDFFHGCTRVLEAGGRLSYRNAAYMVAGFRPSTC